MGFVACLGTIHSNNIMPVLTKERNLELAINPFYLALITSIKQGTCLFFWKNLPLLHCTSNPRGLLYISESNLVVFTVTGGNCCKVKKDGSEILTAFACQVVSWGRRG